ncbi:biotin carboxyl carrier protein of acetyl-CoA carboxylase 1, chloroplastic-like [Chenopodium quinoa]|uniref:biotin carboxyl carrier protein of acetyl-CoA carboxylase 1, chloroplastic-like n=1 Tax=Chenopodium quinoa TaxID=63459 RepID=UPI000B774D8E|nr:biotin carboxyl carrier protein of acetyl-CoA carboxylase 1, chloroplastic-like [Chenopodium quinoa]
MSSCIPTAAVAVVADKSAINTTTPSSLSLLARRRQLLSPSNAAFSLSSKPELRLFSKSSQSVITHSVAAKAQLNNASRGEASSKSEASAKETKNGKPSSESISTPVPTEESISEFITQVAGLIKLVDSRDIVELQMKQHDCELLIRKTEAISQPSPPPMYMMQAPSTPTAPPQASPPASLAVATPAPTTSPAPAPPAAKPAKSSVPPLKSPMSGTFYRSPAPNSPPFVKVGDKVQKGQVVCIIEAMKLMNEIEVSL